MFDSSDNLSVSIVAVIESEIIDDIEKHKIRTIIERAVPNALPEHVAIKFFMSN